MPLLFVFVLALVQGITEFLPISSSGHLELAWRAMQSADVALPPDGDRLLLFVAVHVGTLFAVLLYFWRDVLGLMRGVPQVVTGRPGKEGRLLLMLIVASLPLVAVGLLVEEELTDTVYSLPVIGWATIAFGVLLFLGDRLGMTISRLEHMTWAGAILIGLSQVLALIPGTSRSGITMTTARFLGFEREDCARFSLLLAIPAILGAGVLGGLDLYESGNLTLGFDAALAAGLAFVSAWAAILLMMAWLRRASFLPFVIYRLILGGLLLWLAYGNGAAVGPL